MMWVLGGLAYFVCGVLAYGFVKGAGAYRAREAKAEFKKMRLAFGLDNKIEDAKNSIQAHFINQVDRMENLYLYSSLDEQFCWVALVLGPFSLLIALTDPWPKGARFQLCFRMPDELRQKETSRENRD